MLAVTVIAVCLGVGVMAPGLGILLAIVAAPAFIRTAGFAARKRAKGQSLGTAEKVLAFLGSLGVVITIGTAATVAFVIACFPLVLGGVGVADEISAPLGIIMVVSAFVVGPAAAIWVALLLIRRLWPDK